MIRIGQPGWFMGVGRWRLVRERSPAKVKGLESM